MLELDSKGFKKGTNELYQDKVVVLKRFSTNGKIVLPGDKITLTGDALISCIGLGKVRRYDPAIDEIKEKQITMTDSSNVQTLETIVINEKKLGPKKSKKAK